MRILIVHPALWAHYKAAIYSALQKLFNARPDITMKVLQVSKYERARVGFGDVDTRIHHYSYELLFDKIYEEITPLQKIKRVFGEIRRFKPDVVNFTGYYDPALILVHFLCKMMGIKVVLSIDSTESDNVNVWYKEAIKKAVVKLTDGFFCYGTLAADYMLKLGAEPGKILLKNNAVDNEKIRQVYEQTDTADIRQQYNLEAKHYFIYIGRLTKIKNIDRLLAAFGQLPAKNNDWGLLLVGDGEEQANIEAYIATNNIENVRLIPSQTWQKVPEFLAVSDVLVLPSYSEPWGLVVNEAMVCGKAVIVSDKSGCSVDLVKNGENGFTFSPEDVGELAKCMTYFVENPTAAKAFGQKGEKIISSYHPQVVARQMLDGFESVVE